jgi:predicted nucleotidyltransferase
MTELFIAAKHLEEIRSIIGKLYPKARVWAYGSRVDGSAHDASDLDLAVVDFGRADDDIMALRDAFRESNVPFHVDIFDYKLLPKSFQEEIVKKYVVIY